MNEDDNRRLLRRLSGAIGRPVTDADVVAVYDSGMVVFANDSCAALAPTGNVAYHDGSWWRNGRRMTDKETDEHFAA
jgi:hypothetical protein